MDLTDDKVQDELATPGIDFQGRSCRSLRSSHLIFKQSYSMMMMAIIVHMAAVDDDK